MRWIVFVIFAYVLLAVEQGLSGVMARAVFGGAGPSLLLILAVYIGYSAPGPTVLWAWVILGVLYDLCSPVPIFGARGGDAVIVGPAALGFLAGAAAMLQLRGMVFRGSTLAIAGSVFVVGIMVQLVMAFVRSARGWGFFPFPGEAIVTAGWSAQCVHIFLTLLWTAVVALPVGWALLRSTPLWGFGPVSPHGFHGHGQRR